MCRRAPQARSSPWGSSGKRGNGNTISHLGAGLLLSDDEHPVHRASSLVPLSAKPHPHYEHSEIGYNYRMSNVLAAIGRGQLLTLSQRVEARRRNFEYYRECLKDLPGIGFMPEAPYGRCTRWLTVITVEPDEFGATRDEIRLALEEENIEARPVWKPMHLQPVFKECRLVGGTVSEEIFAKGLCLPSGSNLTREDQDRVVEAIRRMRG